MPAGTFRTYPVSIKGGQRFTLSLRDGASLEALPRDNWPGHYDDFLVVTDCTDCTIQGTPNAGMRGASKFDGQGTQWYKDFDDGKIDDRPNFFRIESSSNFKMLDLNLLNSPQWNVMVSFV